MILVEMFLSIDIGSQSRKKETPGYKSDRKNRCSCSRYRARNSPGSDSSLHTPSPSSNSRNHTSLDIHFHHRDDTGCTHKCTPHPRIPSENKSLAFPSSSTGWWSGPLVPALFRTAPGGGRLRCGCEACRS